MKTKILLLAIVIVSAILRIYHIEQKNLWFDEIFSWKIAQGSVVDIVKETSGDIHPPLYYIILKYWMMLFSDSIFSMRMLSVALSLMSIYFIYKISRLYITKENHVLLVLLLYAVSPLNIFYSQEVRMPNLNLFLCLGSVYYFLMLIRNGSLRQCILFIIFTVLALYTHYFAFLILFSEFIIFIIYLIKNISGKNILIKFAVCFSVINILYIPWYPVFFAQTSKGQPWRTSQTLLKTGSNILGYFSDVFLSIYYTFESSALIYFSAALSFIIVTFIIYVLFRTLNPKQLTSLTQNSIVLLFIIPFLIAAVISLRQSIVYSRYLSILVPYLLIMIVCYSFYYFNKNVAYSFIIFLILTSCLGAVINYGNSFKNNDYRKIIFYMEENFKAEDKIIVEPHFMGWSLNYHIRHSSSNLKAPEVLGWDLNMQLDSLSKRNDLNSVWMILDYSALEKSSYDSLAIRMNERGYRKDTGKTFYVIPAKVKAEHFIKQEN